MKHGLRNKFFKFIGLTPYDYFQGFSMDTIKVLESYENFTKVMQVFSNGVVEKLGIHFDGEKFTDTSKSEAVIEKEYRERGMI